MKELEELKDRINDEIAATPDFANPTMTLDCDVVSNMISIIEKQNEALKFYGEEKNWMITRQDDLHTAKRTVIGDVDSFGEVSEPGLASKLLIVAGQSARKTLSEVSELLKGWG